MCLSFITENSCTEIDSRPDKTELEQTIISVVGEDDAGAGSCIMFQDTVLNVALDVGADPNDVEPEVASLRNQETVFRLLTEQPKQIVVSHFHYDHFGVIKDFLRACKVSGFPWPEIICTRITATLLQNSLHKGKVFDSSGDYTSNSLWFKLGSDRITLIPSLHSVPGSAAVLVRGVEKKLFYTSDMISIDIKTELPKVDYLIVDATRAEKRGFYNKDDNLFVLKNIAEETLSWLIDNPRNRVFITMFSSQLERASRLYKGFRATGHKVGIEGSSLFSNLKVYMGNELYAHHGSAVNLTTGIWAQGWIHDGNGESGLVKLIRGTSKNPGLRPGDMVILSGSIPIWSEEITVRIEAMVAEMKKIGVKVVVDVSAPQKWKHFAKIKKVHVHGHGSLDDIMTVVEKIPADVVIPFHASASAKKALAAECEKKRLTVRMVTDGKIN